MLELTSAAVTARRPAFRLLPDLLYRFFERRKKGIIIVTIPQLYVKHDFQIPLRDKLCGSLRKIRRLAGRAEASAAICGGFALCLCRAATIMYIVDYIFTYFGESHGQYDKTACQKTG
jgi:hypothetical protein